MTRLLLAAALAPPRVAATEAAARGASGETEVVEGETARLTLRVPHGCGAEAAARVRAQVPEGLTDTLTLTD